MDFSVYEVSPVSAYIKALLFRYTLKRRIRLQYYYTPRNQSSLIDKSVVNECVKRDRSSLLSPPKFSSNILENLEQIESESFLQLQSSSEEKLIVSHSA